MARKSRRDAALPTSGRAPGGVPLTWLPGSAAARRTWGRGHPGRIGSRRRPRSHGPEGPGGATRGSWAAGAAWDPSRLSVRPSRHRSCAPERLRDGPLPSGSAGHRPRATIRTIVSAAAAAQMAARSAPPRPPAPPRAAHGESGWASPQPRGPTWPPYREECSLPPPARSLPALPCASSPPNARASSASISRPSAWRTWTRPARLPPAPENSSHSRVAEMGPPRML